MGIKQIEEGIKEELKEDEQFLLKLFQLEKFINKYKYQLITIVAILFLTFVGFQIKDYMHKEMLIKTNTAYNKLLKNPNDTKEVQILKENKPLFSLYLLQTANNIQKLEVVAQGRGIIANMAKYQIAALKGDKNSLQNYAFSLDDVYKNLALLNLERIYLQNHQHKKAEDTAAKITDIDLKPLSIALLHYGIIK